MTSNLARKIALMIMLLLVHLVLANEFIIPPFCFSRMTVDTSRFDPFSIKECTKKDPNLDIYEDYPEEISEGFIGYRGRYKDEISEVYDQYKYLGKIDNALIIWRQCSGGGTGHFSDIYPLKRVKNNFILVKDGPGDRCNGSITDAKIEDNILNI